MFHAPHDARPTVRQANGWGLGPGASRAGVAPGGPAGRGLSFPVMSGVTDRLNASSHRFDGQSGFPGGRELAVVGGDKEIGTPDFCGGDVEGVGGAEGRCLDRRDRFRDHLRREIDDRRIADVIEEMPLEQRGLCCGDSFLAQPPSQGRHDFRNADDTQAELAGTEAQRLDRIASSFLDEPLCEG